jgi:hypothetical protein
MMPPSAVGAALALPPQPDFAITGRGTSLSNKFNATVSTIPLICTALISVCPWSSRPLVVELQCKLDVPCGL